MAKGIVITWMKLYKKARNIELWEYAETTKRGGLWKGNTGFQFWSIHPFLTEKTNTHKMVYIFRQKVPKKLKIWLQKN